MAVGLNISVHGRFASGLEESTPNQVRGRHVGLVPLVISLMLVLPVIVLTPVSATAGICSVKSNYFDGAAAFTPNPPIEGVHAALTTQTGFVCSGDYDQFTTAWVMVASRNGDGGYSQAGFFFQPSTQCNNPYAEYNPTGAGYAFTRVVHTEYCYRNGSLLRPEVRFVYRGDTCTFNTCLLNLIDGVKMSTTNFDILGTFMTPYSPQFYGETRYRESNVPGSASAPTQYTEMSVQRFSDDQWQAGVSGLAVRNDYLGHWGYVGTGCGIYHCQNIWTN